MLFCREALELNLNGKPLYIMLLLLCLVLYVAYRSVIGAGIAAIPKKQREKYPYFTLPRHKRFFLVGLEDYLSLRVIISHHIYFVLVCLLAVMLPLTAFIPVLANAVLRLVQIYLAVNLAAFIVCIVLCSVDYHRH